LRVKKKDGEVLAEIAPKREIRRKAFPKKKKSPEGKSRTRDSRPVASKNPRHFPHFGRTNRSRRRPIPEGRSKRKKKKGVLKKVAYSKAVNWRRFHKRTRGVTRRKREKKERRPPWRMYASMGERGLWPMRKNGGRS